MEEIVPNIFHWTALHPDIGQEVHSYCLTTRGPTVLIDPMVPHEGLEWFRRHATPEHVFLTNRLHYRGAHRFVAAFGVTVWCHEAGLHEFGRQLPVRGFEFGDELPGQIQALKVDALCPEESAFLVPIGAGALSLGDAVIRKDDHLAYVPDSLMGDDPKAVKRGLRGALSALLEERFEHLLLAHGRPFVHGGREALGQLVRPRATAHHT